MVTGCAFSSLVCVLIRMEVNDIVTVGFHVGTAASASSSSPSSLPQPPLPPPVLSALLLVLLARRKDNCSNWQLPQGGIEEDGEPCLERFAGEEEIERAGALGPRGRGGEDVSPSHIVLRCQFEYAGAQSCGECVAKLWNESDALPPR